MKIHYFIFLTLLSLISCKENNQRLFYYIFNENFPIFIDTTSFYNSDTLQISRQKLNEHNDAVFCISFNSKLFFSNKIHESVKEIANNYHLKEFAELIEKGPDLALDNISLSEIKNTGKFIINTDSLEKNQKCISSIPDFSMYKPYISDKCAIFILSNSEGSKAGLTNCIFLKKNINNWDIIRVVEIERW